MSVLQIVDGVGPGETVLLDLDAGVYCAGRIRMDPPAVDRTWLDRSDGSGQTLGGSRTRNRIVDVEQHIVTGDATTFIAALRILEKALAAPFVLRYTRTGSSTPVYARCYPIPDFGLQFAVEWSQKATLSLRIPAETALLGAREDISAVTVTNNPLSNPNGMRWDIDNIKGDLPTPALLSVNAATDAEYLIASRRRGTPTTGASTDMNNGFVAYDLIGNGPRAGVVYGTDTASGGINDPDFWLAAGANFARTTFATVTGLANRVKMTGPFEESYLNGAGTYRLYVRVRKNTSTDLVQVRARVLADASSVVEAVTLPTVTLADSTSPQFVFLGFIQLPVGPPNAGFGFGPQSNTVRVPALFFDASNSVNGTGHGLDWDGYLLVPADAEFAQVDTLGGETGQRAVFDGPNDQSYRIDTGTGGSVLVTTPPDRRQGSFPWLAPAPQANRLVWVKTLHGIDNKASTTSLIVSYWPRYLTLR